MTKSWKWQLEIFRMFSYIMFPVGTFYLFNQPAYFEDWVNVMYAKYLPSPEEEARSRASLKQAAQERSLSILGKKLKETEQ